MSEKKNQRISEIYSYLMTHNYASVNELAQHFNVSISTIKRDLIEMEDKQMTEKVRGGTVIKLSPEDPTYRTRKHMNQQEKQQIGRKAAEFVEDNDVILLLGGTTCFEVYKAITVKNVTVFTTNIETLFTENENVSHLFVLEGEVAVRYGVINGSMTIENLSRISPDKIFFSTSINDNYVLQCRTDREYALISAISRMNAKKVFMSDKSKMRKRETFSVMPVEKLDVFITDIEIEAAKKQQLEADGLKIISI